MKKKCFCFAFFFKDLKEKREQAGYFFGILIVLSYFLVVVTFPLSLCFCLKVNRLNLLFELKTIVFCHVSVQVVQEYERAVIFRLGRILEKGARGSLIFSIEHAQKNVEYQRQLCLVSHCVSQIDRRIDE